MENNNENIQEIRIEYFKTEKHELKKESYRPKFGDGSKSKYPLSFRIEGVFIVICDIWGDTHIIPSHTIRDVLVVYERRGRKRKT